MYYESLRYVSMDLNKLKKQNETNKKRISMTFFFLFKENIGMRIRNSGPGYFISILCNAGQFPLL